MAEEKKMESINVDGEKMEIVGRYTISFDSAEKDKDGQWVVNRTIKQGATTDGKILYMREYSVKSMDTSLVKAGKTSHDVIRRIIDEYNSDFFCKNEWEGKQYVINMETNEVLAES